MSNYKMDGTGKQQESTEKLIPDVAKKMLTKTIQWGC